VSAVIKPVTCIGPAMIDEPTQCICPDCQPLRRALGEGTWRSVLAATYAEPDEQERCECDTDVGVCLAWLRPNGTCPNARNHR
jgi:hypothetical protein